MTDIPLMPKATAIWLIENTKLTFKQIADFCGLHLLEVQAIADGTSSVNMIGYDPISSGQLTLEEIKRCEENPLESLRLKPPIIFKNTLTKKKIRYTPMSKRQDKPDAIAWLIKNYPNLEDSQICILLGTTRNLIKAVRQKTHWNTQNIKPRSPVQLGLCSQSDLETLLIKIKTDHKDNDLE